MKGWKTWTGLVITVASAVLRGMGKTEYAEIAESVGVGAIGVGIAHKIEKGRGGNKNGN